MIFKMFKSLKKKELMFFCCVAGGGAFPKPMSNCSCVYLFTLMCLKFILNIEFVESGSSPLPPPPPPRNAPSIFHLKKTGRSIVINI